ncbi:MAG: acyl-CoA dehydrogenase, partial [Actinomycetia bacterium]|nr:acyl-CoA dehydrogenase [Actinomycetes bacterium]
GRGSVTDRVDVAIGVEAAVGQLECVARAVDDGLDGEEAIGAALLARYGAQASMAAAVELAAELLGGMAFVRSPDIAHLMAAVRALAFHPPSRTSAAEPLATWLTGGPLDLA